MTFTIVSWKKKQSNNQTNKQQQQQQQNKNEGPDPKKTFSHQSLLPPTLQGLMDHVRKSLIKNRNERDVVSAQLKPLFI